MLKEGTKAKENECREGAAERPSIRKKLFGTPEED